MAAFIVSLTLSFCDLISIEGAHLTVVGKTEDKTCPQVMFHTAGGKKEMLALDNDVGPDDSVYKLGDWPLSELLQAYQQVHVPDTEYDMVNNNCASFVLTMMCHLSIPVTPEVLDFTVSRLMATDNSTDSIHQGLAMSAHLTDLPIMSNGRTLEENKEAAVSELVYYYAATHEDLCVASTTIQSSKNAPAETWFIVAVAAQSLLCVVVAMSCFFAGRRSGTKASNEELKGDGLVHA